MSGNYKNIKFKNTLANFKRWCREFPPLDIGQDRVFDKHGDYYISIECVEGYDYKFAGITIRKYDAEFENFEVVRESEQQEVKQYFRELIDNYKKEHDLEF